MKNENLMAIVVIGLIAIIALQTLQIFAMGQSMTTRTPTAMAGSGGMMGQQQFSSVEEMMAAHHGTGTATGGMVGGCGGH